MQPHQPSQTMSSTPLETMSPKTSSFLDRKRPSYLSMISQPTKIRDRKQSAAFQATISSHKNTSHLVKLDDLNPVPVFGRRTLSVNSPNQAISGTPGKIISKTNIHF